MGTRVTVGILVAEIVADLVGVPEGVEGIAEGVEVTDWVGLRSQVLVVQITVKSSPQVQVLQLSSAKKVSPTEYC